MQTNAYPMGGLRGRDPLQRATNWSSRATGDASIEFGRFHMLPRRRQLLADGVSVESEHAPLISYWSCWRLMVLSSQRRSFSTGCGRPVLCRKRTSRLRSPHCVKRLALTAS